MLFLWTADIGRAQQHLSTLRREGCKGAVSRGGGKLREKLCLIREEKGKGSKDHANVGIPCCFYRRHTYVHIVVGWDTHVFWYTQL